VFKIYIRTFHGLDSLACSASELTSDAVNTFRYFGGTLWMGDQPIARPVPTQNNTTDKCADIHPRLEGDSNL
jgi:hypothetical protein